MQKIPFPYTWEETEEHLKSLPTLLEQHKYLEKQHYEAVQWEQTYGSDAAALTYRFKCQQYLNYIKEHLQLEANQRLAQNGVVNKQPQKQIEPIIWDADNILLGYLIQWLKDNGFISKKTGRDTAIKNHFVDTTGKPIVNIKQGLNNVKKFNDGALPKDFEKIEPLLNNLKQLKELFEESK